MAGSGGVKVVEQEYLPILLASGRRVLVVKQIQVIVDLGVFDSPCILFLNCW